MMAPSLQALFHASASKLMLANTVLDQPSGVCAHYFEV